MSDHTADVVMDGEPEGGWVSGPTLYDTEIVSTTLCRFTGHSVVGTVDCINRLRGEHPDVDCFGVYVLQRELEPGGEVTLSRAGSDPTVTTT